MKKLNITMILILVFFALIAKSSIAQDHMNHQDQNHEAEEQERFEDVPEVFRANLTEVVEAYISGKEALLVSDLDAMITSFETFIETLKVIGSHGLSGDGHMAWMESYAQLTEHASTLAAAGDIGDARVAFRHLSEELAMSVKKFGVDGVLYHQYCPMAIDSKGATWLSGQEQIQNPYTPETMIGCGEVIERIEKM
ncbi:MAG: DUF3347 domain-containing protein [Balneolales bacterium]